MRKLGEWGLLLALLAIPVGVFFYWQKGQAAKRRAALKASAAAVPAGAAFPSGSNPAETGTRSVAPAAAAAAAAPGAAPADAATPAPTLGAPGPAPAEPAASGPTAAGLFAPKRDRDPMQSVMDRQILMANAAQMKLQGELAAQLAAEQARLRKKKKRSIEDRISLQGVMEIRGTLSAIVNGEMVSKGQEVKGARVVKITQNSVTFEHKGKFFTKRIKERVR